MKVDEQHGIVKALLAGLFTGHDPGPVKGVSKSRGSGRVKLHFKISPGRVGSGQEVSKSRGSGLVGSIGFKNLAGQVGLGQEVSKSRGSGRVGSGQEVFKTTRVGSGHDPRDTGHSQVKPS